MSELNHPDSINRDYIRLLQVMRRFVREEFAVSIRMTQDDAVEQLLHYGEQSRNHVLQEMAKELQEFVHGSAPHEAAGNETEHPQGTVRYYRGVAITVEDDGAPPVAPAPAMVSKPQSGGSKKIYRGRVVEG